VKPEGTEGVMIKEEVDSEEVDDEGFLDGFDCGEDDDAHGVAGSSELGRTALNTSTMVFNNP
jgi:hypothetical protein